MPWLKAGDNAATHPIVMRVAALVMGKAARVLERDIALNEVFGFVTRCALQSAGHTTDYAIDEGTALMLGGARTERLLELARKAGYLTPARRGGVRVWMLVDDPDFLHMRLRDEIAWEAQQRADSANTALTAPVRYRDGDACRYCGQVVSWGARKGGRRGTYDHRIPGEAATVDTLVVACGSCNAARRDRPDADTNYPLQPAPARPFYTPKTAVMLTGHGYRVTATDDDQRPGIQPDTAPRPASQADHATSDPAASRTPRRAVDTASPAPTAPPRSAETADRLPTKSGFAGSGRVGSGRFSAVGNQAGSRASPTGPRKRSSRGRPRTGGHT